MGRPSHQPVGRYKSFLYQAASWQQARWAVSKVEFHCGELFFRVAFIVTNLALDKRAVVCFYNKRGTGGTVDKGKQADGRADAAFLSPLSGQGGATAVERHHL
jgi:hypothetical protein